MDHSVDAGSVGRRRRPVRRAIAAVLVCAFALSWWAFLRPASLGGPLTMIVVNGVSMEPGLHSGDLAVVWERDGYARGDVIAFRHRNEDGELGSHVIHRIIGGDATRGFVLQGDNNDWVDAWEPTADQVAGRMLFHVPALGKAVLWIAQPLHLAALFAAVTVALVAGGGRREDVTEPVEPLDGAALVPTQRKAHDAPVPTATT
jgi:signal peptidase